MRPDLLLRDEPSRGLSVIVNEGEKRATVYVSEDQQSIAIGRADRMFAWQVDWTGYELDIEAKALLRQSQTSKEY